MSASLKQAVALHQQGKSAEAKKLYQQVLSEEPENPQALHFLGLIAYEEGQFDLAQQNLDKSLKLRPNNPVFNHNAAGILSRLGEMDRAIYHFEQAIKLKPDYGEAYQGLTESKSFKDDSKLLKQIQDQLENNQLTDHQANYMHFAAAKIEADSDRHEQAFSHYTEGNQLKNAIFDNKFYQQQIDLQIQVFTPEFIKLRKEWGLYNRTPIFVIGMPRSGTTLIEQVLASHSSVFGAGELNDITAITRAIQKKTGNKTVYPLCIEKIDYMNLLGFGFEYIQQLQKISRNTDRVINKHPLNFKHLGLILLLFPNAKIIHTVRDPLDTCLSCYFQNFSNGQEYSFDLDDLGEFYNGYCRLMNHWKNIFPDKIYDVSYENMILDQEQTSRDLLQHCDLAWEDNCLNFHRTDRDVSTASKFQVRQPIYKSSLNRWQRYEQQLQPLIQKIAVNR